MSDDYYYLKENIDYKVTYTNNVNAGTAEYCIKGIGNYVGEIRGTFEIEKNVPKNDGHFLGKQVAVGDTVDVVNSEKSRCCRCESVHRGKPELYCDGVQNRNVTHLQ